MKLFLVGMMGSGKSYWAQRLSDQLHIDWIDLDQQIEKDTSLSVPEIFAGYGESYFREKERDALRKLTEYDDLIISTGGGTPCFYDNIQWMNKNGITVWIDEPVDVLCSRLQKEKDQRPLLKDIPYAELHRFLAGKLTERSVFYAQARFHLQGGNISDSSFAEILTKHE